MKKWIAIFLASLLFLQAIPVLHFLAAEKSVFYSYVDEDKPEEVKLKEKKEQQKECLSVDTLPVEKDNTGCQCTDSHFSSLPAPYLESFSPPPDFAC